MSELPTRPLGKNGPQVTALGFGAMGLSAFHGKPMSDEERFKVLDRVYDLGERFWDTSDSYLDNESLLGKWFKRNPGKRETIFLATKFGFVKVEDGNTIVRTDSQYVKQACLQSLAKLGVDHIDIYYAHRVDRRTPIEETVAAMAELKKEGRIKYLGHSEVSKDTLRRACAVHPITAVQMEYSPFAVEIESPETKLLETCRELGVAVVAYSPLGNGLLSGKYRSLEDFEEGDFRKYAPRFSYENFSKNLHLVKKIAAIAEIKGCSPGQLTLAWELAQGADIIPIPGTKKIRYLEENMGALNVVVTDEEVKEIRKAVESAEVAGQRYPGDMMDTCFADTPPLK